MALPFVTSTNNARGKDNRPHRFAYDFGPIDPGMSTPGATRNIPKRAPKRSLAYTIPLPPPAADNDKDRSQGHVLGANSLALSFTSSNANTAENTGGLLFSGGRDGVVKAWDLNIPVRQKEGEETEASSVWAIDRYKVRHSNSTAHTTLRESQVMHSDWVNDIVVVGDGSTVISASSDQTVRAWSPFNTDQQPPCTIGAHLDYVKALAYSPHRQMVISGGLDRRIKLWDVGQAPQPTTRGLKDRPMAALQEFGDSSLSSIYALSCNTQGSLVVSGSPENFMRLWDTRMSRQLTTLTGHTDHVRAVLLSPDSELILSGSSDSTVKLWSMRMRRCLSTFTHHSDSVWSLHSTHPRFQTFYSGSRDGLIAKTIGAGMFVDELPSNRRGSNATTSQPAGISRSSTGGDNSNYHRNPTASATANVVCVAIAKESQGVVKLVAADDTYIWTATKGTELNRWLDVTVRPSQHRSVVNSKSMTLRHGSFDEETTSSSSSKDSNNGYSQRDSSEIVTQKSLIMPWQDFTLGISGLNGIGIGDNSATANGVSKREVYSPLMRHRRNRTIDYSSVPSTCKEKMLQQSPHLMDNNIAVSPVLKAIQEEKAQLKAIHEDEDEDESENVEQPQKETTPPSQHPRSHSRTQSVGGGGRPWTASPITTILTANNTSIIAEDPDNLSIPDSPLPAACLMKSGSGGSKDPSPSVVETEGVRQNHSQQQQRQINGETAAAKYTPFTFAQDAADPLVGEIVPVREKPEETIYGRHGLHRFRVLDNRRQVLAQDTRNRVSLWDIMLCRRIYEFPESENSSSKDTMFPGICGTDFDDIFMSINLNPESVNTWCHVDTRIGSLTVHLEESWVWNAEVHVDEVDEVADEVIRAMGEHERVNIGQWMLKRLFLSYARTRVKRGTISVQDAFLLNCWSAQIPAAAVLPAGQQGASSQQQKQQQVRLEPSIPNSNSCTNLALAASAAVAAAAVDSSDNSNSNGGSSGSEAVASANAADVGGSNGNRLSSETPQQPLSAPAISRSTSVQGIVRLPTLGTIPKSTGLTPPNSAGKQETSTSPDTHKPMTMCIATQLTGTTGEIGLGDQGEASIITTLNSLDIDEEAYDNGSSVSLSKRKPSHSSRLRTGNRSSPRHHHKASIDTAPSTTALASATQKLPSIPANSSSRSSSGGSSSKGENKEDGGGAGESANNSNNGGSSGSTSGKFMNRLLSMRVRRQKSTSATNQVSGTNSNSLNVPALPNSNRSTSTPGGAATNGAAGLAASSDTTNKPSPPAKDQFAEWAGQRYPTDTERTLALLRNEPAPWEQLYSPIICPRLPLPHNVVVQMYQECFGASEPYVIYRNTVEGMTKALDNESNVNSFSILRVTDDPLLSFELCMPAWLTDFLLYNRLPASYQEPVKISFILSPASQSILPPFPNPNARLVANRMLRARKLAVYVVDKLGLPLMNQPAPNYVNAVEACVRSYQKKDGGEEKDLEINANMYIDLFTKAGEELSDMEREALTDMALWMDVRHHRAQRSNGKKMYVPEDNDGDDSSNGDNGEDNHTDDGYRGKPELYLDLSCKDKQVSSKQTLATIKTIAWKSSSDVQIHYDWAAFVKQRISQAQTLAQQQQQQ